MRTARLLAMVLVSVAVLGYSAWLLEFVLPTGLSAAQVPVRELTAPGQPYREVFIVAEFVTGGAFLLAGPPLVRIAPVHWTARATVAAIASFGVVLLVDAAYPMTTGLAVVQDVIFLAGAVSLVAWWGKGWRELAAIGLILLLLTRIAQFVLTSWGPDHFAGAASRANMVLRAALLVVGVVYVVRVPGSLPRRPLPAKVPGEGAPDPRFR